MAHDGHVDLVASGVDKWNEWRFRHPEFAADLSGIDLCPFNFRGADFSGVNFSGTTFSGSANERWKQCKFKVAANLSKTNLRNANLSNADLRGVKLCAANLRGANLYGALMEGADFTGSDLSGTDLSGSDFRGTVLCEAKLTETDLSRANLTGVDLSRATLVKTNLERANLTGCRVYGASTWNVRLADAIQKDIIITPKEEPTIQVDWLDVAQFVYLLLNNAGIRRVIDTITSKVVLILGRFTAERKAVLDALRAELRRRGYLPIVFDWEKPSSRDIHETVSTLAHMARFVIADITDAKSIPQELTAIVPNLPSVPVQPLVLTSDAEYGMFEHFKRFPWVLPVVTYDSQDDLISTLEQKVISPAEATLHFG